MIPDSVVWWTATRYAWLHGRARSVGVRLRGLGWLLRRVRGDRVLQVDGVRLWFDHRVASSYDHLVAGELNEPETAAFLTSVLDRLDDDVTFVDVGANVGEFLIPLAAHRRVVRAIGFEPVRPCAEACERSAELNAFSHVHVHRALVADGTVKRFAQNPRSANVSAISEQGESVQTVRLDDALAEVGQTAVLLVDVEGAEPLVLSGGSGFIQRCRPLIVFEYNFVSRRHFRIESVRDLLGPGYSIFRLRRDGRLDSACEQSWNCVAVPLDSAFEPICRGLIVS
jgi:FkbM family methyltransferase